MKKQERQQVFEKFGGKCAYCGCELQKGWHVDHLEAIQRNWKDTMVTDEETGKYKFKRTYVGCCNPENEHIDNYMPSCASCNINKHSMPLEEFRKAIAAFMLHLNNISTQYKIAKRYGLAQETDKPVVFYFETINAATPANG